MRDGYRYGLKSKGEVMPAFAKWFLSIFNSNWCYDLPTKQMYRWRHGVKETRPMTEEEYDTAYYAWGTA